MSLDRPVLATLIAVALVGAGASAQASSLPKEKIGVVFVHHGSMDRYEGAGTFDSGILQWVYDRNSPVYRFAIWNPPAWGGVITGPSALKYVKKYEFEYARIGGLDPFGEIQERLMEEFQRSLIPVAERNGVEILFDWSGWIPGGEFAAHFPYPRAVHQSPFDPAVKMTYCGDKEPGATGPWPGCDPERFNVDGPFERLADQGATRIFMVDLIVGGVRFYKGFDVYTMASRALADWAARHGTTVPLTWLNDPSALMASSYPVAPAGWTGTLGAPAVDVPVELEGRPNPVVEDPLLARLNGEGIVKAFNDGVPLEKTGIVLLSHYYRPNDVWFDPKINDTIALNERIEAWLLKTKPQLVPDNIVGAFLGLKELNPETSRVELTRAMRGEDIGGNLLYENRGAPAAKQGFRLWDALEYLKNRGVEHIVVAVPQINGDSVLSLVEIPNQVAREIGFRGWRPLREELAWFRGTIQHPFADYWGVWANPMCGAVPCCFTMGGCADGRLYPPTRQTLITRATSDLDPWLAWDVPEYGHLGFDPALGPPNPAQPVQDQYRGTWSLWRPSNDDPQLAQLLAHQVELGLWNAGLGREPVPSEDAEVGLSLH